MSVLSTIALFLILKICYVTQIKDNGIGVYVAYVE